MNIEEYFQNNQLGVDVFRKKYTILKDNNEREDVTEAFTRVASHLAEFETDKEFWTKTWVQDLLEGWYRPGGSILSGVGSKTKISLINCTTIPLKEDSLDSISKCNIDMMKCASRRQGLGVDVSALRPAGSFVDNSAEQSTGAIPWMDWLASMGSYVGQKGRIPAILLSIKVEHPDTPEFCTAKSELGKIQTANISVQVSDRFMEAVKANGTWKMTFTSRHETTEREMPAKELFDLICSQAWQYAEPGVQFIDKMRQGSMIHQIYEKTGDERFKIISTNACSEKPLSPYSCCVLGSLNMGMFPTNLSEYKPILRDKVNSLIRMLDNAISYEIKYKRYGVPEQKEIMELTREVGMGFTNLHQWFLNAGVQYDSDEAAQMIEEFQKWYSFYAFEASQNLAAEKGPAGAYLIPSYDITPKMFMESTFFSNIVNEFYNGDPNWVKPLRNLALISIAPTGTLSLVFPEPCVSTGAEPIVGPCYWKKTRAMSIDQSYEYYFCFPKPVKDFILSKVKDPAQRKILEDVGESVLDKDGSIGNMVKSIIEANIGEGFFKPAHEIDPLQKVKMLSGIYKYVDACVSITYNLPNNAPKEIVGDIYMAAWEQGVRAVSVYRDGSREGILLFEFPKEGSTKEPTYCEDRPKDIIFTCAPKREKDLSCDIHHCKVQGKDWLVLIGLHNGYPYEIFAGEYNDEMYVPKTVKEGILRKNGKAYSLIVPIKKSEVEYKDIAETFMNEQYRSLTRMISIALRHGVRPAFITDQLKKADEGITEFSSAVSRVFNKYMKSLDYEYLSKADKDECPYCKGTDWIFQSGCKVCANCGKGSKCD